MYPIQLMERSNDAVFYGKKENIKQEYLVELIVQLRDMVVAQANEIARLSRATV